MVVLVMGCYDEGGDKVDDGDRNDGENYNDDSVKIIR